MIGAIILLLTAILLAIVIVPIGFIFGLLPKKDWWKRSKQQFLNISYAIDQFGNVVCKDLFNWALIHDNKYSFGFPDETISSVLGKNKLSGNLTGAGILLDKILDFIDPNHSIDSIDNSEGVYLPWKK